MGAGPRSGVAVESGRRGTLGNVLLCALGSVAFVHAGIGIGTFIRGAPRANEFLRFGPLLVLLVFLLPGFLIALLAWDGLRRRLQRVGRLSDEWRSYYAVAGGVIIGTSTLVSWFDPYRWYQAAFIAPECVVAGLGTVLVFVQSKRE